MPIPVGTAVGYLTLDYSDFNKNLTTAVSEATTLSGKFSSTLGQGLSTVGSSISSVGATISKGITLPLGIAAASSVTFGAQFDKQMSEVKAVTNSTSQEFETMRDAAIEWGGKTVYTATEAGQALYYMGLAGWDAEQSVNGLGGVLNLAAAGNLDLGRTSDIVTDAMTAMGLEAGKTTDGIENTTRFVNAMAAAMSNSNTDVDQLGEAFKYVAPLAGSLGFSIEDLNLALGLMANVGVKSSQAGTGLRQALKNLISPTDEAKAVMDKYGVSLFDSQGKAKTLRQFMQELRATFKDLGVDIHDANGEVMSGEQIMEEYGKSLPTSQQEKLNAVVEIFGTRALPGILGIIDQSDENFNSLAESIDGANTAFGGLGYAAGMAETQMDNLQGDWIRFTSALGTARIAISDIINGSLRQFVQTLTDLVNKFNNLDKEQQAHILKIAAMVAAIGPLLFIFGKLVSTVGNVFIVFNNLSKAVELIKHGINLLWLVIQNLIPALTGLGGPVLAVVAAIGILTAAFVNLVTKNEQFRERMSQIWNSIKSEFEGAGQAIVDLLNSLGFDFENFGEVVKAAIDGIKNAWDVFCQFVAPVFEVAFSTVAGIIKGLVGIFTGVIQIITGIIQGISTGEWTTLFDGMKKVAESFFTFLTAGLSKIPGAIYEMIATVANYYGANWPTTWEEAKQKVSDFVTNLIDWFTQLPGKILMFITNVKNSISEWGKNIVNKAKEVGSKFLTNIINFFKDLPYNIGLFLGYVITSVIIWVTDMTNKAIEAGSNFLSNIVDFFTQLPGKVLTFLTNTITNIQTFKTEAINKAKEMGSNFISNVVSFIKQLPGKIHTWLSNTISKVSDFKTKMISKAKEAAKGFKDKIVDGAKSIPSKMLEIGKNIVQGVWKGIQNAKATFVSNINSFFSGIVAGAKKALGIASPSKVMANEVGAWLPPGITEGFEKAMPKAVGDIQNSLDKGVEDINTDEDLSVSVGGFADEFMGTVNKVTIWFESIEERFANIVNSMRKDIHDMINLGNMLTTPNGLLYNYRTNMFVGEGNDNRNSQNQSMIDLLRHIAEIIDDKDEPPNDTGGDIIIPVYIGEEKIDTLVVNAIDKNNYRSGGR